MIGRSLLRRTSVPVTLLCDKMGQLNVRTISHQSSAPATPDFAKAFPGFLLKQSQSHPEPQSVITRYPANYGINMPQPGGRPGIPPIGIPIIHRIPPPSYENPNNPSKNKVMEDPSNLNKIIEEDPTNSVNQIEKKAARLIVIRRTKMNKHKLLKLRKKMKYVWAKVKLRRRIRVEKAFLNAKMAQIREAQKFDAKAYVADIIRKATEVPFPTRWRGQWLPEPLIREKLEQQAKRERQEYLSILNKRVSSDKQN